MEEWLYPLNLGLIRLSIIAFYLGLPFYGRFKYFLNVLTVFVAITTVGNTLLVALRCVPPNLIWNFELPPQALSRCIEEDVVLYITSGISLASDFLVLLLPIKTISGLSAPTWELTSKSQYTTMLTIDKPPI
jgi:hypothetical protein